MKFSIFIVLLSIFSVYDAAPTATQSSSQSPSCMDYSTVMCEVAFKISNNRKKFCYERGHLCCETCNGTHTASSATTATTTTRYADTTTEGYMIDTTTESNDESASCTDVSSVVCKTRYDRANDKISFCIDNGYLCCDTCDEK